MGGTWSGCCEKRRSSMESSSGMTADSRSGASSRKPLWLKEIRSAVAVDGFDIADPGGSTSVYSKSSYAGSGASEARHGLTYARCIFRSPLAPQGPAVVVERALVDTGSSDCELLPRLLSRMPTLPVLAQGAVYETSCGSESYDAYEILLTVGSRTCAAVVTCSDQSSSDDALLGHMAIGALGLLVDCPSRCLRHVDDHVLDSRSQQAELDDFAGKMCACGELRAIGPLQFANASLWWWWKNKAENPSPQQSRSSSRASSRGDAVPLWLPQNACAMPLTGLALRGTDADERIEHDEALVRIERPIIPVTYVRSIFTSPLRPQGPRVVVEQALVDTGAADCEIREGLLRRLLPLPVVARGLLYETVTSRVLHDSYEVLISIGDRTCAAAATVCPESRFAADAEDVSTDEGIIGYAALAALGLLVDPSKRQVI